MPRLPKAVRRERQNEKIADARKRFDSLSRREREVFASVVSIHLNKQAGAALEIAERTVKMHRSNVMQKMNADSVAETRSHRRSASRRGRTARPARNGRVIVPPFGAEHLPQSAGAICTIVRIARRHQEAPGGNEGQSKRRLSSNLLRCTLVASGTPRRIAVVRRFVRERSEADMPRALEAGRSDDNDPSRT
jgi:DNA-binding CsgD family transcriptional regulator